MRRFRAGKTPICALALALASVPPILGANVAAPDVVLVTLDTTRADHLGCYGDGTARTPTLDTLAARGARFSRALTAAPITLPAHATLMTGLDPPHHGLHDNGLAALPDGLPTLAGAFAATGYATGAVIASGVLDHRFGLDRGFAWYDDHLTAEERGEYGYPERDAAAVTDAALAWARDLDPAKPYFLWVHYYDPHSPYLAHDVASSRDSEEARYAGEIAHVDRHLGRLLAGLPGDSAERLVAVVGDHGEMLGEHGERAHGLLLYRGSLEVPLIVSGKGVAAGTVVGTTVATRGLAASLARLAGLATGDTFGPPLPGLPTGESEAMPIYSEAWLPATAYGWSRMLAVSEGRWRYVEAPRPELYDFVADPGEQSNLLVAEPERAADLQRKLGGFAAAAGVAAKPVADAAELQAQLRALGYLSGMSGDTAADGIDPKDGIGLLAEFEAAKELLGTGDVWAARTRFDDLVRRNPSNVPFLMRAADARLATGDTARGLALIEKAIAINPRLDLSHQRLAEVLMQTGDAVGADAAFREALELNPRLAGAWLGRAQLAAMAGDGPGERALLDAAVEAGTLSGGIFARLGQLALAAGDLAAAEKSLAQATRLVPQLTPAWWSWGEVAERQGDLVAAAERFDRAITLSPRDPQARLHLGRLLAQLGRNAEARQMLEVAAQLAGGSPVGREAARLLAGLAESGSR